MIKEKMEVKKRLADITGLHKAYVLGPMSFRSDTDWNYPAFHDMEDRLQGRGFIVRNPATQDEGRTDKPRDFYLRGAIKMLTECDAAVALNGWEDSDGAVLEVCICLELDIPVYDEHWMLIDNDRLRDVVADWAISKVRPDRHEIPIDFGSGPCKSEVETLPPGPIVIPVKETSTGFIDNNGIHWECKTKVEILPPVETLPPDELLSMHVATCEKARGIMAAKNKDYTNGSTDRFANFRLSSVFDVEPEIGLMMRMTDKMKRIQSFVSQGSLQVKDEPVDDAIVDIINYAILLKGLLNERRGNITSQEAA